MGEPTGWEYEIEIPDSYWVSSNYIVYIYKDNECQDN